MATRFPSAASLNGALLFFKGMVSSYNETLDFFSPEGIPLRATVALTLKEDAYQFLRDENTQASQRNIPTFSSANASTSAAQAASANGKNPKNWRDIALFNGIEDVRAIGRQAISVPNMELEKMSSRVGSPEIGFGVGASASLGSSIPGAFKWK
jgi:hypothetical protein